LTATLALLHDLQDLKKENIGNIERKWLKNNRDPLIQDILFIESLEKKVTTIDRGNSMCFQGRHLYSGTSQ